MRPMTTRRWMLFVAVLAVGLTGLRLYHLRQIYGARSQFCGAMENTAKASRAMGRKAMPGGVAYENADAEMERYMILRQKYERATRYPWLPVE